MGIIVCILYCATSCNMFLLQLCKWSNQTALRPVSKYTVQQYIVQYMFLSSQWRQGFCGTMHCDQDRLTRMQSQYSLV